MNSLLVFLDRKRVQLDDWYAPWAVDWRLMQHNVPDVGVKINPSGWAVSAIRAVEAQFEKMTGCKI